LTNAFFYDSNPTNRYESLNISNQCFNAGSQQFCQERNNSNGKSKNHKQPTQEGFTPIWVNTTVGIPTNPIHAPLAIFH